MTGFLSCVDSHYNMSMLERTINECSTADLWRMTEELKAYILSPVGKDKVAFEETAFQEYFRKYLINKQFY